VAFGGVRPFGIRQRRSRKEARSGFRAKNDERNDFVREKSSVVRCTRKEKRVKTKRNGKVYNQIN